jgi:rhodanese-related sulfurtransferase
MIIEQMYTGLLAYGAYYIESNGEAAIHIPLDQLSNSIAIEKAKQVLIITCCKSAMRSAIAL